MRKRFTSLKGLKNCIPILFLLMGVQLLAQIQVNGTVTSKNGQPIPGVNVLIEGTSSGTTTDFDGNYVIEVPGENSIINFSYVGFVPQAVTVGTQTTINVVLEEKLESLEQIVVIGYGQRRKSDLTGSVTSVAAEEINAFPAVSAAQTLQGRAAGVNVQSTNGGEPGAPIKIRVRGSTSINASGDALFVVDGFIGGALPPPDDIESIQILKDASSTAIYGARGANGVVIVTTKKGKKGKMQVDFNTSYSTQEVLNRLDMLNGDQFRSYLDVASQGGYVPLGANTDWQDQIYRTGSISNYQLAVSGGSENAKYYLSGTFFDQEGVIIESNLERFSFTSNVTVDFSDFVKIGFNTFGSRNTTDGVRTQEGSGGTANVGVVGSAYRFSPDAPIRDADGNFVTNTIGDGIDNPVAIARGFVNENINDRFQTNIFADLNLVGGLNFKSTLGYGIRNGRRGQFFPSTVLAGAAQNGRAVVDFQKRTSVISENYFTYKDDFSFARLEVTAGYSYQKNTDEDYQAQASNFPSDQVSFRNLSAGSVPGVPRSSLRILELSSYFGRVNFDVLDRYLFTASLRRDGSSTFSENNKWGYFPSGAFAWNMGNESFLEDSNTISQWKWRVSYGITGNPSTDAYESISELRPIYSIQGNEQVIALAIDRLESSNLKWEETAQLNVGLDLGFFNNRINLTADYYKMNTTDLLLTTPLPQIVGIADASLFLNAGEIENRGFELEISTKNLTGNFTWNTDLNISRNENEVVELVGDDRIEVSTSPGHLLANVTTSLIEVGQPVGVFFGFIYDGVYQVADELNGTILPGATFEQEAGGARFRDISGPDGVPDGQLTEDDRTIIGDPNPDFIFGFNNTFGYKGFDLNVFFQGSYGGDMLNFTALETDTGNGGSNATTAILDAWTSSNPNTDVPAINGARAPRISTRWVEDGSYVRLKNVTLGYSLSNRVLEQLKLSKLRLYISGQNLLTLTDYSGLDPEVLYQSANRRERNINGGFDYASYPNVRQLTLGLNVSF